MRPDLARREPGVVWENGTYRISVYALDGGGRQDLVELRTIAGTWVRAPTYGLYRAAFDAWDAELARQRVEQ